MNSSLFDYKLPQNLISQKPIKPRDGCGLMVYNSENKKVQHRIFNELPKILKPGDVLVVNDTKVFPARLYAKKETGGSVEVFLLNDLKKGKWKVLLKHYRTKMNTPLFFKNDVSAKILKRNDNIWTIQFNKQGKALDGFIRKYGLTPTPPYIKEKAGLSDYQTIYAKKKGSVAAPTAGFHFTAGLIKKLEKMGIVFVRVTLHVGLGTFEPVKEQDIKKHKMHMEKAILSSAVASMINKARKDGRRIIAVGTTSVRLLEGFADSAGRLRSGSKNINIFIYPGYRFKMVDGLITNFHLPKSTLLMLVAGFISYKEGGHGVSKTLFKIYNEAIRKKYKFYSFGDAMLIV